MQNFRKILNIIFLLLLAHNSVLATESASDFFEQEDKLNQIDYKAIRMAADISLGAGLGITISKTSTLLEYLLNAELSEKTHQIRRLKFQLENTNTLIQDYRVRLNLTKDYPTIVKISDELEPQLARREILIEKLKHNIEETNNRRKQLIQGVKKFSNPNANKNFRVYQGLRRLAKLGIIISIVDFAGHFITKAYTPNNEQDGAFSDQTPLEIIELPYNHSGHDHPEATDQSIWQDENLIKDLEKTITQKEREL